MTALLMPAQLEFQVAWSVKLTYHLSLKLTIWLSWCNRTNQSTLDLNTSTLIFWPLHLSRGSSSGLSQMRTSAWFLFFGAYRNTMQGSSQIMSLVYIMGCFQSVVNLWHLILPIFSAIRNLAGTIQWLLFIFIGGCLQTLIILGDAKEFWVRHNILNNFAIKVALICKNVA